MKLAAEKVDKSMKAPPHLSNVKLDGGVASSPRMQKVRNVDAVAHPTSPASSPSVSSSTMLSTGDSGSGTYTTGSTSDFEESDDV